MAFLFGGKESSLDILRELFAILGESQPAEIAERELPKVHGRPPSLNLANCVVKAELPRSEALRRNVADFGKACGNHLPYGLHGCSPPAFLVDEALWIRLIDRVLDFATLDPVA